MRGRFGWLLGSFCLLCLWLLPVTAWADKPVLRVGYVPMQGFLFQEDIEGGRRQYSGYAFDYMQVLAGYLGWDLEYVSGSWDECLARLQSGEIDLLPGSLGEPAKLVNVAASRLSMGNTAVQLVMEGGTQRLDALQAAGHPLRLGRMQGSYESRLLKDLAADEGLPYEQYLFTDYADLLAAARQGDIDGYMTDMLRHVPGERVAAVFDSHPYPLLVRADRTELLHQIDVTMDRMMLDDPTLRTRLYTKNYMNGDWTTPLALQRSEKAYLKEKKKLTVVTMPGEKPVSYFENGRAHGVVVQILQRMAEDLGLELEFIPTDTYTEALQLVSSGQADIMAAFFEDFNWAKTHRVILTQPYMKIDYLGVTRRSGVLSQEPMVACLRNAFYTHAFVEKRNNPEHCIYFDTTDECLQAVRDGRADIAYVKAMTAIYNIWQGKYHDLKINGKVEFSHGVVVAVNEGADPRLLRVLNREIEHLDENFIHMIVEDENADAGRNVTLASMIYNDPLHFLLGAMAAAAAVILVLVYINWLRRRHVQALQHTAYTDARTGLPNLAWLEQQGPVRLEELSDARREGRVMVVMFNISAMQMIIENYDRAFIVSKMLDIAADIRQNQSWIDMVTMGTDAGRLACLCCMPPEADAVGCVAAAVRQYDTASFQGIRIRLHLQAGICRMDAGSVSLPQAIDRADIACNALRGTAGRVRFFDDVLQQQMETQQKIESHMEKALDAKEFAVWYQPKYDLLTRAIVGAEALVRWESPEMGFLSPGQFIGLFERNGFVLPLDYYVLDAACAMQRRRLDAGQKIVPVSVNQSRLHMREENYIDKLQAIVYRYALPAETIELELTETIFGNFDKKENRQHAREIIRSLHAMGFSISVDDFGSGYSSLMLLSFLPMDVMKIDRSLLMASEDSARMQTTLANVIRLGKSLHMKVICEGIETVEQEQILLKYGWPLRAGIS